MNDSARSWAVHGCVPAAALVVVVVVADEAAAVVAAVAREDVVVVVGAVTVRVTMWVVPPEPPQAGSPSASAQARPMCRLMPVRFAPPGRAPPRAAELSPLVPPSCEQGMPERTDSTEHQQRLETEIRRIGERLAAAMPAGGRHPR